MNDLEALLILNSVDSVGSVRIRLLINEFGSAAKVIAQNKSALMRVKSIGEKIADNIGNWQKTFDLKKEISLIGANKVKVVTIFDDDYPRLLKEIYDPPIVMYVRGTLVPEDKNAIGVVGSRWASYYGRETAERLSRDLARRGITIVSGLARGVDTCAHGGALKGGGRTLAILGNGLTVSYPPENKELADAIAEKGAVISEFPMETIPDRKNFPKRNRVISGLSLGVVVVEAAKRSGALITAGHALEQNRTVFSVPGRIDAVSSSGSNDLIKQGAKVVTNAEDVLEEFEYVLPAHIAARGEKTDTPRPAPSGLTEKEKKLYDFLTEEKVSIDTLIGKSGLPAGEVSGALLSLELKDLIKQLPGKEFMRVQR